jgi:hypothetical protein
LIFFYIFSCFFLRLRDYCSKMETKRPAADAATGVPKGGAGQQTTQTQPTGSSTAAAPVAAGAEGGFYRVAGVGLLLLVIGIGVLFYSASVLTLTCRADNDPNPYVPNQSAQISSINF